MIFDKVKAICQQYLEGAITSDEAMQQIITLPAPNLGEAVVTLSGNPIDAEAIAKQHEMFQDGVITSLELALVVLGFRRDWACIEKPPAEVFELISQAATNIEKAIALTLKG